MSNFDKVREFNIQFGVTVHNAPQPCIFDSDPKLVDLSMALIHEEVAELDQAVKQHDLVETVDALADILYVVYGMGARLGVDLDEAFRRVHESNMSKLCANEEEARETVRWYREQYERHVLSYDSPTYRLAADKQHYVVYNESTGKVLKSTRYHPVDLRSLAQ